MTFLPKNEDGTEYEVPVEGNYMRFEQGDNKFRILSDAVIGWEGWVEEGGKPVPKRFVMDEKPIDLREFDNQRINHFWAFVVWNYQAKRVQILQITQKGIMKSVETLTKDEDWGSPLEYDIVINRDGEGLKTKYETNPKPKKELGLSEEDVFRSNSIELEKLFEGKNPFGDDEEQNDTK